MLLNPLTLHLPKTSLEAARLFKELEDSKVLAGGTFLLNSMKLLKTKGTKTHRNILSLAHVEELKGVSFQGDTLTIKAMTRINDLMDAPLPQGHLQILHAVCRNISTNPIRNMATMGGNLTCRYTWTEMGAVMIALDAKMHFLGQDEEEIVVPEDFFKNAARSEKLFTHVTIKTQSNAKTAYRRVKKTIHVDVPSLAICLKTEIKGKQWYNTRVGINNGVAFAQRDSALEEFLDKSTSSADLGKEALEHLTSSIYDTRSSDYKKHMFRISLKTAMKGIMPEVNLTINKKQVTLNLKGNETLLEVLRDQLSLTGTKTACQETECGTCTVMMNGKAVLSCITLAANIEGQEITTIEGLAQGDVLHPVQQAFIEYGSVQCGFCIPGMIMSSVALLEKNPTPTQTEIEYALDGNICRCAGYPKIFEAVHEAGKKIVKMRTSS